MPTPEAIKELKGKKIGKYPTIFYTAKRLCIPQMPSSNLPSGNTLFSVNCLPVLWVSGLNVELDVQSVKQEIEAVERLLNTARPITRAHRGLGGAGKQLRTTGWGMRQCRFRSLPLHSWNSSHREIMQKNRVRLGGPDQEFWEWGA